MPTSFQINLQEKKEEKRGSEITARMTYPGFNSSFTYKYAVFICPTTQICSINLQHQQACRPKTIAIM